MFPIPSPYAWDRRQGHLFDAIAGGGCRPCSLHSEEGLMAPQIHHHHHHQRRWVATGEDEIYAAAAGVREFAAPSPPAPREGLRLPAFGYQGGTAAKVRCVEGPPGFLLYAAGGAPARGSDEALQCRADVVEAHWLGRGYGVYGQEQAFLSAGDVQANIGAGSMETSPPIPMEDSNFKVSRLSPEERKEKIHRYMKKRNERNFTKKIKYACRKTLADSRPRVRGRFAKNDEDGEPMKPCSGSHDDLDEEEEQAAVKEEDILDSDILAHISGLNSFTCNFPLDSSWI